MNASHLAKKYQQAPVNILSQITTIAKTTPNLIDFSIGDPDLITDQEIIEHPSKTSKTAKPNIPKHPVTSNYSKRFQDFTTARMICSFQRAKFAQQSVPATVCT